MPFTEMGNTGQGIQLGRDVKNLIWDMLTLICMLDTQMEVLNGRYVQGKAD